MLEDSSFTCCWTFKRKVMMHMSIKKTLEWSHLNDYLQRNQNKNSFNKYLGILLFPNSTSEIKLFSQEKTCHRRYLCITAQALWAFSSVQWTDGDCYKLFKPVFTANFQAICHGFCIPRDFKFLKRDQNHKSSLLTHVYLIHNQAFILTIKNVFKKVMQIIWSSQTHQITVEDGATFIVVFRESRRCEIKDWFFFWRTGHIFSSN